MISQEEARTRVARGAAHLDQVRPGWFNEIDTGTLTMSSDCHCIVGQLLGSYEHYRKLGIESGQACGLNLDHNLVLAWPPELLAPTTSAISESRAVDLNAIALEKDCQRRRKEWPLLQDAWIAAIADRRLSITVEVQTAVDAVGLSVVEPVAVHART